MADSKYSVNWNINCMIAPYTLTVIIHVRTIIHYPTNILCVYFQSLNRKDCF